MTPHTIQRVCCSTNRASFLINIPAGMYDAGSFTPCRKDACVFVKSDNKLLTRLESEWVGFNFNWVRI